MSGFPSNACEVDEAFDAGQNILVGSSADWILWRREDTGFTQSIGDLQSNDHHGNNNR